MEATPRREEERPEYRPGRPSEERILERASRVEV